MFDSIRELQKTLLVGSFLQMSWIENHTSELWSGFMPQRKRILNSRGTNLFSMQVYQHKPDFMKFDPAMPFTKWAAVEVRDHQHIPKGLHPYVIKGGLYAVFNHRGTPQQFPKTFDYIFSKWFPESDYDPDHREHFEVLPEHYRPNDPEATEEVWVPITVKRV